MDICFAMRVINPRSNVILLLILSGFFPCQHQSDAVENIPLNFGKNIDISVLEISKTLNQPLITRLTEASFVGCLAECVKRPRCISINYRRTFLLCELNQREINNNDLQDSQRSIFSQINPWISSIDSACSKSTSVGDALKAECIFNEHGSPDKRVSDCGQPPGIHRASADISNGIGLLSKVMYNCENGYLGNGKSTITCLDNGSWSDHEFQCIKICGPGKEPNGDSCNDCAAGTYSPSTDANNCFKCPVDYYQDLQGQETCLNCTIGDNPCREAYSLQDTNVIVEPNDDRTECRAVYFCRDLFGVSIQSQNVFVICDRDGGSGAYSFHWTRPSLHCISGISSVHISTWYNQYDDCGQLEVVQVSNSGQLVQINTLEGGNLYCDNTYDGGYWTVVQQRSSALGNGAFDRSWQDFKTGFGSINDDYWIGNDNLHRLTDNRGYEVLILLWDEEGNYTRQKTAVYKHFHVKDSSDNYQLLVSSFDEGTSDAGDAIYDRNGWRFSAKDRDSTGIACSDEQKSGWWHKTYFYLVQKCTTNGNVNALKWTYIHDKTRVLIKPN